MRVGSKTVHPILVEITINGKKTPMKLDKGAIISIISTMTMAKLFAEEKLIKSTPTYSGAQLKITGQMPVNVKYGM